MPTPIIQGATVGVPLTSVAASTGALTDATAVSVKIVAPDGTSQTLTLGSGVSSTGTGAYLFAFTATQATTATAFYEWTATLSYDDGNGGFWYGVATGTITVQDDPTT